MKLPKVLALFTGFSFAATLNIQQDIQSATVEQPPAPSEQPPIAQNEASVPPGAGKETSGAPIEKTATEVPEEKSVVPIELPPIPDNKTAVPPLVLRASGEIALERDRDGTLDIVPDTIGLNVLELVGDPDAPNSSALETPTAVSSSAPETSSVINSPALEARGAVGSSAPENRLRRRGKPDGQREDIPASKAATKKDKGTTESGVFFRGDSRAPDEVFKSGFQPQGRDMDLQRHLSLSGGSGYVSLSRSSASARPYAFGRTGEKKEKGYLYLVAPNNVPNGYYLPEVFSKDGAVRGNREFAVAGAIPPSAISGAYELDSKDPKAKPQWKANGSYGFKKLPCSGKKRELCELTRNPDAGADAGVEDEERGKKKEGEPGAKEDEHGGKKKTGKGKTISNKISQNRFLLWISESSPEAFKPLIEAIKEGGISVQDYELAFKRALSQAVETRYTDFSSWGSAAETLLNIVTDVFQSARLATPPGFWEEAIKNLPAVAREISKAQTAEEKMEIANRDIHPVVKAWSFTPMGLINESLMKEAANQAPVVQGVAATANSFWSYTPFGWIVNQIFPIETLIRQNIDFR
ncbi:hypothetical protein HRG_006839 [Hirsutella rhossiliensis]|uniref:Pierisin-like domain-containing protein n=1 Tax=Hirsutella rhossiliensis TaxID=111463 RepID=A0A9P8SH39_9HYPO|nr:uncharacterized protein HRG_06839 [Hirsutella rhossiliensis]KAH0961759.1 hypothetical protein HRG_06839 [Hirsutella rhossiliensis]